MEAVLNSPLFTDMTLEELKDSLQCSGSFVETYKAGDILFYQEDTPKYLYILKSGSVNLFKDTANGNQTMITTIQEPGDIFGEVYLFLNNQPYDLYAHASSDSEIIKMPKQFFFVHCDKGCNHHEQLTYNMLSVLSGKAYFLNKRVQLLLSSSLREKISFMLYDIYEKTGNETIFLDMKREDMANFLGVTRPSLSRELLNMQDEGLLSLSKNEYKLLDIEAIENIL